jgi:TonB family protein
MTTLAAGMFSVLATAAVVAQPPASAVQARDREIARLEARIASGSPECSVYQQLGKLYLARGDFDLGLTTVRLCVTAAPAEPAAYAAVAEYLWTRVASSIEAGIHPDEKGRLIDEGIRETEQALGIDADYLPAVTLKHMFVRLKATLETDPVAQRQLMDVVDHLRRRAHELERRQTDAQLQERAVAAGRPRPVRVGGDIRAPQKTRHVDAVYPEEARAARVQGVVILEATIGSDGKVADAKVLRSIPLLDQAALDAVLQWEFEPSRLDGDPVPVIMTVTVNFSLR